MSLVASAPIWNGRQLAGNWDVIWYYVLQHARYTTLAVSLGVAVALPASYVAHRVRGVYPVILAATNIVYAIPSLTLFALLSPWLGWTSDKPIVLTMAMYTLIILVRNIVESIRGVPEQVVRAADGMGYRPGRRFVAVELPLAVPGIVAGLRLATVSTVSLISVGAVVGRGAIGKMFLDGYQRKIPVELWAGLLGVVGLALLFDLLIYSAGRLATPWAHVRGAT